MRINNTYQFYLDWDTYIDIWELPTDVWSHFIIYKPTEFFNYNTIFDCSANENDREMWIYDSWEMRERIDGWDEISAYPNLNKFNYIVRNYDVPNNRTKLWLNAKYIWSNTAHSWVERWTVYIWWGNSNNTEWKWYVWLFLAYNKLLSPDQIVKMYEYFRQWYHD